MTLLKKVSYPVVTLMPLAMSSVSHDHDLGTWQQTCIYDNIIVICDFPSHLSISRINGRNWICLVNMWLIQHHVKKGYKIRVWSHYDSLSDCITTKVQVLVVVINLITGAYNLCSSFTSIGLHWRTKVLKSHQNPMLANERRLHILGWLLGCGVGLFCRVPLPSSQGFQ